MNLPDLIIIYLACGSPFGVYQITKRENSRTAANAILVATSILLWPLMAISLIYEHFVAHRNPRETSHRLRIEGLRTEIESIAFADRSTPDLFEFRELFYRFTGLVAAEGELAAKPESEIFEVSGHDNTLIASRCLARRNQKRLEFHQMQARSEFVDMISDLARRDPERDVKIVSLALELTRHLGDVAGVADLSALLPGQAMSGVMTSTSEKEAWKSHPRSSTAVN